MSTKNTKMTPARFNAFLQQYRKKAQKGIEPNDRRYDLRIQRLLRRMKPEEIDELMNGMGNDLPRKKSK